MNSISLPSSSVWQFRERATSQIFRREGISCSLLPNRGSGAAASTPWSVQIKNTETAKHTERTSQTVILPISENRTVERIRVWSMLELRYTAELLLGGETLFSHTKRILSFPHEPFFSSISRIAFSLSLTSAFEVSAAGTSGNEAFCTAVIKVL